jgi:hypothetical protein
LDNNVETVDYLISANEPSFYPLFDQSKSIKSTYAAEGIDGSTVNVPKHYEVEHAFKDWQRVFYSGNPDNIVSIVESRDSALILERDASGAETLFTAGEDPFMEPQTGVEPGWDIEVRPSESVAFRERFEDITKRLTHK